MRRWAERGSGGRALVQQCACVACWWDLCTASVCGAGCPPLGWSCARLGGAGGTVRAHVSGALTWDVERPGGSSRHVPPPWFYAVVGTDCWLCEAAYAGFILLLLLGTLLSYLDITLREAQRLNPL